MTDFCFIQPTDVLYLRGNALFGGSGDHGAALMPPWPSVAAGALRSRILADAKVDFSAFKSGEAKMSDDIAAAVGSSPSQLGAFRLTHFLLGRKTPSSVEPYMPTPADLVIMENDMPEGVEIHRLQPAELPAGIQTSRSAAVPLLRIGEQKKPSMQHWLNAKGIKAWIRGETIEAAHLTETSALWSTDPRLGIALDAAARTAADGGIYTADTIAMKENIGFLIGVEGAASVLPNQGLVRLGGDGRAASVGACKPSLAEPDWPRIEKTRRFRLMLTTPGVFPEGWRLPGQDETGVWRCAGIEARVVCAAVPRYGVISGWDLAEWRPKDAVRYAPVGSVWWLEMDSGDIAQLQQLIAEGLPMADPARRAEGFNRVIAANW
jgi:CRISPR-associated protein Cmr3